MEKLKFDIKSASSVEGKPPVIQEKSSNKGSPKRKGWNTDKGRGNRRVDRVTEA